MTETKTQSFNQRLLEGFESLGDVTFSVGEAGQEEEIKAATFILRVSSPVFEIMFNSTWNGQKQVIKIPDIRPEMFRIFLKLLVASDLNESHIRALNLTVKEIVSELLYIAEKYQVTCIHSACIRFLKTEMTGNFLAAALVYEYARTYNEVDLQDATFTFISKNASFLFRMDDFLNGLSRDSLACLLKRNGLDITEVLLFKRVCKWAEIRAAESDMEVTGENLRKVLGDLLFLIRFPLMSLSDLAKVVRPTQILTGAELLDLYDHLVLLPSERRTKTPFDDSPRRWNQLLETEQYPATARGVKNNPNDYDVENQSSCTRCGARGDDNRTPHWTFPI